MRICINTYRMTNLLMWAIAGDSALLVVTVIQANPAACLGVHHCYTLLLAIQHPPHHVISQTHMTHLLPIWAHAGNYYHFYQLVPTFHYHDVVPYKNIRLDYINFPWRIACNIMHIVTFELIDWYALEVITNSLHANSTVYMNFLLTTMK